MPAVKPWGRWGRALFGAFVVANCLAAAAWAPQGAEALKPLRTPDVPYQPSGTEVVEAMLRLANVTARDMVFDLGCGDGRIVIAAARGFGARGVCVDIDPQRIAEARENAHRAGVSDRIRFLTQDLFETDIGEATAVMLFLWPEVNLALRPKLLRELRPGTRVGSHWHEMGDWKPQRTERVAASDRVRPIHLWIVPGRH